MTTVSLRASLAALESALVEEFRALQGYLALIREERRALLDSDWLALEQLLLQKEAAQANLERLEAARVETLRAWAAANGLAAETVTLTEMLPHVEPAVAQRLASLREGILSLATEVRSVNRGNQSLASLALDRAAAVRDFLVDLAQPAPSYQPFKNGPPQTSPILAVEQWA